MVVQDQNTVVRINVYCHIRPYGTNVCVQIPLIDCQVRRKIGYSACRIQQFRLRCSKVTRLGLQARIQA